MGRSRATLVAVGIVLVAYVAIAWLAASIDIPANAPAAASPWLRPLRVLATLGFLIASPVGMPHVIGQFLAAILLGGLLGAVFATIRFWLQ